MMTFFSRNLNKIVLATISLRIKFDFSVWRHTQNSGLDYLRVGCRAGGRSENIFGMGGNLKNKVFWDGKGVASTSTKIWRWGVGEFWSRRPWVVDHFLGLKNRKWNLICATARSCVRLTFTTNYGPHGFRPDCRRMCRHNHFYET